MQAPDPEMRNRPAANRAAIHISQDALTTPLHNTAHSLRAQRLAARFLLQPETAAVLADLAYGGEARA